jgi:hypothetical protein
MLTIAKFRILPSFIGRVAHRINRDARLYANFSREKWRKRFSPGASLNGFPSALVTSRQSDLLGADDEQCAQAGVNALGAQ